jgi:hypothetical protein
MRKTNNYLLWGEMECVETNFDCDLEYKGASLIHVFEFVLYEFNIVNVVLCAVKYSLKKIIINKKKTNCKQYFCFAVVIQCLLIIWYLFKCND